MRLTAYRPSVTSIRLPSAPCILAIATLVACCAVSPTAAAAEPQITAAGIDADDRLVATWTLASGTRFESVEFASSPILDDDLPGEFADLDSFAGYECAAPSGKGH